MNHPDAKVVAMLCDIDRGGIEWLLDPAGSENPAKFEDVDIDVMRAVVRGLYLDGVISADQIIEAWESTP